MRTVTWDGEIFTIPPVEKWTIGEVRYLERNLGRSLADATDLERSAAAVFVAIKRLRPGIPWSVVDELPMEVLMSLTDTEADAEAPPIPDGGGGASGADDVLSPISGVSGG